MREETENWWEHAKRDLKSAEKNFEIGVYYVSAFLSQQAVEKSLKALYVQKYKELWKIHDLVELAKKVNADSEIIDACVKINPVYTDTRYPDVSSRYTKRKADEVLKLAKKVLKWIEKNL